MKGMSQALAGLRGFTKSVRRKHTRIAMMAGGGILKEEAKRRITKETGLTRRSLIVKGGTNKKENAYSVVGAKRKAFSYVEPGKRKIRTISKKVLALLPLSAKAKKRVPSRILHLIEGGSKKHQVRAKNSRILTNGMGAIFGSAVSVGARPKPFMTVTVRSKGNTAVYRALRKIQEGIEIERRIALAKAVKPK